MVMNPGPIAAFVTGSGLEVGLLLFFAMLIGHAVADYPLQGDFLAKAKSRHADPGVWFGERSPPRGLWVHALSAHAMIHAGAVWLVTGSPLLALVEAVLHWLIDFVKCEGLTDFNTDQLLHLLCKAAYATVIAAGLIR